MHHGTGHMVTGEGLGGGERGEGEMVWLWGEVTSPLDSNPPGQQPPWTATPLDSTPLDSTSQPGQQLPAWTAPNHPYIGTMVNVQAVCILLECNLV